MSAAKILSSQERQTRIDSVIRENYLSDELLSKRSSSKYELTGKSSMVNFMIQLEVWRASSFHFWPSEFRQASCNSVIPELAVEQQGPLVFLPKHALPLILRPMAGQSSLRNSYRRRVIWIKATDLQLEGR